MSGEERFAPAFGDFGVVPALGANSVEDALLPPTRWSGPGV
jgi:hypothetical protein